jgi:hypothetical protein
LRGTATRRGCPTKGLDMTDGLEGLAGVLAEREPRLSRPRVAVIGDEQDGRKIGLAEPGTIALLVASDEGASMLDGIERSVARKDFGELEEIYSTLKGQYVDVFGARRPLYESRRDIPFLTEFRYAGKTLRQGMVVAPRLPVAHSLVLYNGARLALDAFSAVEYRRADSLAPAHTLVVVREPRLTELEQAILGQISDTASPFNTGESVEAWTDVVVNVAQEVVQQVAEAVVEYVVDHVVEVVAEAVVAAVVGGDDKAEDERVEEDVEGPGDAEDAWQQGMSAAAAELREMDPNLAARSLLKMRANLLGTGKATLR